MEVPQEIFENGPLFRGHVVHVADRTVAARWGPMLRQALRTFAASGTRVTLITDDTATLTALESSTVARRRIAALGGWHTWRVEAVLRNRLDAPCDLLHLWGTTGLHWIQRWARKTRAGLLIHALSTPDVHRLARTVLSERIQVALIARRLASANATGWRVISPGVGLPRRPVDLRTGERTLAVLCATTLDEHSGVPVLLDALAQLRARQCDVQAAVVGTGRAASTLWRQIRARQVHENCVLIDDPHLWEKGLPGADVCVVPARQRELWLTPLLAMGLGKLVIASRDQPAEWFIEGRTCWEFTPGSAVELAYLLTRAMEQPQQVRETTESAAEYFHSRHTVASLIGNLAEAYRNLASQPGAAVFPGGTS